MQFETSLFGNEKLPLVLTPKGNASRGEFLEFLTSERQLLRRQLREHGGLLFRGWPVSGAQDFSDAVDALGTGKSVNYIGGDSPRRKVTGSVYTSTEAPPAVKIPLHNEMSFVRD